MGTGTLFVKMEQQQQQQQQQQQEEEEEEEEEEVPSKRVRLGEKQQLRAMDTSLGVLRMERSGLNVTQREESVVVQYLTLGGFKKWLPQLPEGAVPSLACSGVHAGPGQLSFGHDRRHRADLTLVFPGTPSTIFVHNYHEHKVHYSRHGVKCPQHVPHDDDNDDDIVFDEETTQTDHFKRGLAEIWTRVRPDRVVFVYSVSTACDFFHGAPVEGLCSGGLNNYENVEQVLQKEFDAEDCQVFARPPRPDKYKRNLLSVAQLKSDILAGTEKGFVTVVGGSEKKNQDAGDHFGFCVQSYACQKASDIGEFTRRQIVSDQGWGEAEAATALDKYMTRQPARTLNSDTFHTEETLSTSYLAWLMRERGFDHFEITHFVRYKFVKYWNSYLVPLLQKRHEQKKRGDLVASTINKLIQNSHYGRQGMESSNYDETLLTTGQNLSRIRKSRLGHLSGKRLTLLGLVRLKEEKAKKKKKKKAFAADCSREFFDDSAMEAAGDEEEEEEEEEEKDRDASFGLPGPPKKIADAIEPFSDSGEDSDSEPEAEVGDLGELSVAAQESGEKKKSRYEHHFLYACTFSGKNRQVVNNLPGAVAVLSNSKKIFLGHINVMLSCGDPRLVELCYIDTDSCIFSMSRPTWEECVLPEKLNFWYAQKVMADEEGANSCHGQMKCEGMYGGGLFKTLKIYRLYDKQEPYTRCKGVNRHLAKQLKDVAFDSSDLTRTVLSRTCLRPTPSGQIAMLKESRSLAVSYNFKRKVTADGIHSFPISFLAEC